MKKNSFTTEQFIADKITQAEKRNIIGCGPPKPPKQTLPDRTIFIDDVVASPNGGGLDDDIPPVENPIANS